MKTIQIIEKVNKDDWQELISNSNFSSPFQTIEFYEFLKDLTFLDTFLFGVLQDDVLVGLISGYITQEGSGLKAYFSRRAIIHSGVLLSQNCNQKALETLLLHTVKQLKKRAIYIEIRNYFDYSQYKTTFAKAGFKYEPHLNFHVKTETAESAFAQLNSTKRRDVRITKKNGVELLTDLNSEQIKEFYTLLEDLYKTKVKLPIFPIEFFEKINKLPASKMFMLQYEGKIIGGSVCLELKDKILYELYVCGLDKKFKNIYPSTFVTWSAIEYAGSTKVQYFDMMGAGKPNDGYGVRNFKSKFGGELVEYGRLKYICSPFLYKIGQLGLQLLKKK